jgi:hypothetical protein
MLYVNELSYDFKDFATILLRSTIVKLQFNHLLVVCAIIVMIFMLTWNVMPSVLVAVIFIARVCLT